MNKKDALRKSTTTDQTINLAAEHMRKMQSRREWNKLTFLALVIVTASPIIALLHERLGGYLNGWIGIFVYLPFLLLVIRIALQGARGRRLDRQLYKMLKGDYEALKKRFPRLHLLLY